MRARQRRRAFALPGGFPAGRAHPRRVGERDRVVPRDVRGQVRVAGRRMAHDGGHVPAGREGAIDRIATEVFTIEIEEVTALRGFYRVDRERERV